MSDNTNTPWTALEPAELPNIDHLPLNIQRFIKRDHIYLNNLYQVNVRVMEPQTEGIIITHLSIKLRTKDIIKDWRHFQLIKNQLCGEESLAIEIYPPESKLVDTANQYHLWVFPPEYNDVFNFMFQERLVAESNGEANMMGIPKQRPFEIKPVDITTIDELNEKIKNL